VTTVLVTLFIVVTAIGTLVTIVGLIVLALRSHRPRADVALERRLASHRRRTLIRMADPRIRTASSR
jgi:hypothetical protein